MDYKNLESKLIRQQNRYIRQLEEQLAVYEEKDKAQALLLEQQEQALELLAEELSRMKSEKETNSHKEV